jgi:hypothetical protein
MRIGQILNVFVSLAANLNKLLKNFGTSKHVETVVVFAEVHQDSVGVESLLEVVLVFGRKRVEQAHNDLVAFLCKDVLHFLLLGGEHAFVFNLIIVIFSIGAIRIVHGHACLTFDFFCVFRLNLDLKKFNHKQSK